MTADEVNAEVQRRQAERRKDLDPMQKRSVGDRMDRWQEDRYDSQKREEERRRREEERQREAGEKELIERISHNMVY